MSRFYSDHEIKRNENRLNEDLINAEKYKQELKKAINKENHRVNVDSAKKKAVLQRMDYDGFHQMVLGADLKGIKEKDMKQLKPDSMILNNLSIAHKLCETKDIYAKNFVILEEGKENLSEMISKKLKELQIGEEDGLTIKIFEKNFVKVLSTNEDKINYLLEISLKDFNKLFENVVIETDLFLNILNSIAIYILEKGANESINSSFVEHLFSIIDYFVENNQFKLIKKFISKKYKVLFDEFELKYSSVLIEKAKSKWHKIKSFLITII